MYLYHHLSRHLISRHGFVGRSWIYIINVNIIMLDKGGSRNVERGMFVVCRPFMKQFVLARSLQTAVHRGVYWRLFRTKCFSQMLVSHGKDRVKKAFYLRSNRCIVTENGAYCSGIYQLSLSFDVPDCLMIVQYAWAIGCAQTVQQWGTVQWM